MGAGQTLHVGVLAYDRCLGTEIFGVADLLLMANRIAAATVGSDDLFRVSVIGRRAGNITTAGGIVVRASRLLGNVDTLIVPGFELSTPRQVDASLERCRDEVGFIASIARDGVPVASVCVGAFLLGEAGLLDGRHATTSWLFADELQRRYPDARVDADLMIASDGNVTTTAAFNAVHDLALRIIQLHAGDDLTRQVARVTLVADNRNSQTPYVDDSLLGGSTPRFARDVQRWLIARLAVPYDLASVAAAFHVSTRTLLRRFGEETGMSPLRFLQAARVNAAKRLLESADHSVADAMSHVGYSDPGAFRRLFTAHVGVSPAAYRRAFRSGQVPATRAGR